jgi:hypothetical protein
VITTFRDSSVFGPGSLKKLTKLFAPELEKQDIRLDTGVKLSFGAG